MDKCPDLPVIQKMLKVVFAALCAGFISMPVALALEIEGVKLDDSIEVVKGGPKLVLNGAGVRHKLAFVKVYVGSLYLQAKKSDSEAVFADTGAKRVTILERLHQRYNTLRVARERIELLKEATK